MVWLDYLDYFERMSVLYNNKRKEKPRESELALGMRWRQEEGRVTPHFVADAKT
jgi:hypothetical protein